MMPIACLAIMLVNVDANRHYFSHCTYIDYGNAGENNNGNDEDHYQHVHIILEFIEHD